ncbi:DDE superfamily endonuclease [Phytophthora infestans]|uniref:DDE superfamily endonuclease n=1 Tax=Phytophthora infestans TaxID=4787 RepID=A0A833WCV1_PHYIN|nr:DDE superfamily endonuclease [Phytophthora infestans]
MDFVRDFLYFDQALVAIDGAHVPIAVSAEDTERFRNRKGWISNNVLIASDWQLNVAYIYPGAEGAAHDSMVLARSELLQLTGHGMYVLADAGYALHPKVLTPFRGVRYHLKEFAEGFERPRMAKELFNWRHAKARNAVERLNGCLKRRFKILRVPIECEFTAAKAVIFACVCLHNFIRREASSDLAEDMDEDKDDDTVSATSETLSFDFNTGSQTQCGQSTRSMWEVASW